MDSIINRTEEERMSEVKDKVMAIIKSGMYESKIKVTIKTPKN